MKLERSAPREDSGCTLRLPLRASVTPCLRDSVTPGLRGPILSDKKQARDLETEIPRFIETMENGNAYPAFSVFSPAFFQPLMPSGRCFTLV
jgi:hypothetical protein